MATVNSINKQISGTSESTNLTLNFNITVNSENKIVSYNGSFNGKSGISANGSFNGGADNMSCNCNQGQAYAEEAIVAIKAGVTDLIAAATAA